VFNSQGSAAQLLPYLICRRSTVALHTDANNGIQHSLLQNQLVYCRPTSQDCSPHSPTTAMAHMTNPLATVDQLYRRNTLSSLPRDLQETIFYSTQLLTQAAGLLLRLPQSVTAQANVILARYWLVEAPLSRHDLELSDVSAAALFLTAKLSAHPAPPRDLSNVYAYLLSRASPLFPRRPGSGQEEEEEAEETQKPTTDPASYYLSESAYTASHNRVLAAEARILCALAFDTHVALPHPLAITYLQALDFMGQHRARISRRVVEYLNTALLNPQMLYLTHQPNALAVAAIYNAARDLGAKMPECAWWEVFDVDREELGFLVVGMRSLEGLVRKLLEDVEEFARGGMITRKGIEAEMKKRGLAVIRNGADGNVVDEEEAMMRSLDERVAQMES
jgi:cyclin L